MLVLCRIRRCRRGRRIWERSEAGRVVCLDGEGGGLEWEELLEEDGLRNEE